MVAGFMESLGPGTYKLLMQLLTGFVIIVIIAALYFGSKKFFEWRKLRKSFKIEALVHNPDGTFYVDRVGKFRGGDEIDKMIFKNTGETMPVINPKYIRALKVELWRYGVGQYAVIPQSVWGKNPQDFKIEPIDMQMKNFAYLEQRAAVSRWTFIKDALTKWGPFITIIIVAAMALLAIWLVFKSGSAAYAANVAARMTECKELLNLGSLTPSA